MKHRKTLPTERTDVTAPATPAADFNHSGIDFTPCPDEVARRAYFTYVNAGSAQGNDVQHWLDAETCLIQERNRKRVHGFHHKT